MPRKVADRLKRPHSDLAPNGASGHWPALTIEAEPSEAGTIGPRPQESLEKPSRAAVGASPHTLAEAHKRPQAPRKSPQAGIGKAGRTPPKAVREGGN